MERGTYGEVAKLVTVAADEDVEEAATRSQAANLMSVCEGTPPGVIAEKGAALSAPASAAGGTGTSMTKSLSSVDGIRRHGNHARSTAGMQPELQGHG
jgi:hypothetical protein